MTNSSIPTLRTAFNGTLYGCATLADEVGENALTYSPYPATVHRKTIAVVAEAPLPDGSPVALLHDLLDDLPIDANADWSALRHRKKSWQNKALAPCSSRTRLGEHPTAAVARAIEKQWLFDLRSTAVTREPGAHRLPALAWDDASKDPWREKHTSTGARMFATPIIKQAILVSRNAAKSNSRVQANISGNIA